MSVVGPLRQAAFFGPTVANGALRTHGWTCSLPHPVANDAVDGAHSTGIDVPKGGYVKEQPGAVHGRG